MFTVPIVPLASGKHIDTDKLPAGMTCRYGRVFKGLSKLQIELVAFREDWQPPYGLGRYEHCKRLIQTIWPHYEYNPWSELMFRTLCGNDLIAMLGCTNSGKSRALAMYALLCWWSAPQDTAVAVTSTDVKGSKGRVWGHLVTAHGEAQWMNDDGSRAAKAPGTVTDSPEIVKLKTSDDGLRGANQQAIQLVAAGNEVANLALRTLQGLHNRFVLLLLDELQDLTPDIIGPALLLNLKSNDRFQICAAGNMKDGSPLATFCKPDMAGGYDDVNEETQSWPIERVAMKGVCIRFDQERSPNVQRVALGLPEYDYAPKVAKIKEDRGLYDDGIVNASEYYRQYKAYITPKGAEDGKYAPSIITKFKANAPAEWVKAGGYLTVVGCDPSYTSGGDRFVLYPIRYGLAVFENREIWTLEFQEPELLQHNVDDDAARNYAMVIQARRICTDRLGVSASNFAVDCSGENPLGEIFAKEWSDEIMRVYFQGKPSELPVSLTDRRPSSHVYVNKGAELWGALAVFMRHNQVRGIGLQHQKELANRKTDTNTAGSKLRIEDKPSMRKRLRYSCDIADAGNVGVELLRVRHGAVAGAENTAETSRQLKQQQEKSMVLPVRLASQRGISRMWGR